MLAKGMIFVRRFLNRTDARLFLTALGVVLLSEMGDKTQLSTLLLAGENPHYVFWVGLGSALALISTSFLEVIIGSQLIARFLKPSTIRIISSLVFLLLGLLLITGVIGNIGVSH